MQAMSKKHTDTENLPDPQDALSVYFDSLLLEEDIPDQDGTTRVTKPDTDKRGVDSSMRRVNRPVDNSSAEISQIGIKSPEQIPLSVTFNDKTTLNSPVSITQPKWGHSPFQCLTFRVGGITLAIPRDKVRGIIEIKEKITELPGFGCAPWLLGLFPCHGQNVQVVDIAQIVLPERKQTSPGKTSHWVNYLILVGGGRFGLAVEGLSTVLSLEPKDIRWRREQDNRSWMAGTVIEHMCAVLDVESLSEILADGLDLALNKDQ